MRTKLVYVLTCAPEDTYIEQAFLSIFSARYHNQNAHIVLILDQPTEKLLIGHRSDLLEYITEKLVVRTPFDKNSRLASRWLKSSVRNLIDGDYLFIDCDTIITSSLSEVDNFKCQIGAVLDCHLNVCDYPDYLKREFHEMYTSCNYDFSEINDYFSSGVLYVKDSPITRTFYREWNTNWVFTNSRGVSADQISLGQTNLSYNIIEEINGIWNCIMFTRPPFVDSANIIHFTSLLNNSFLFSKRVLSLIKEGGLSDYIIENILNPTHSFFPYQGKEYAINKFFKTAKWVSIAVRKYGHNIDSSYNDVIIKNRIRGLIIFLYKQNIYFFPTILWMLWFKAKHKCKW